MGFEVTHETFSGPLELLLELIQKEKLPITDVSLSKVAEAYLAHVNTHTVPPEELADFLVVSSKLLLIKSRAILPEVDCAEEDGPPLADQLRMYKQFVEASVWIQAHWEAPERMVLRVQKKPPKTVQFSPPAKLTSQDLAETLHQLLRRLKPFFALSQTSMERVVSVAKRIEEIRAALLTRSRLTFQEAIRGSSSKVDIVVSFLALLELVKSQTVHAVQSGAFDDIVIKHAQ